MQESRHIIPVIHSLKKKLDDDGNYVLTKSGRKINEFKEILKESGKEVIIGKLHTFYLLIVCGLFAFVS